MTSEEMKAAAVAIDEAQKAENNGRGSKTAQTVVQHLQQGNLKDAQNVYGIDGDKLRQYPALLAVIEQHLGCRLHYVKNCQRDFCRPFSCQQALDVLEPLYEDAKLKYHTDRIPVLCYAIPRLKKGDWEGARWWWCNDADKVCKWDPEYEAMVKVFGEPRLP